MEDRQHHTREFKLEAVRLLDQSDRPASEIAVQLGVKRTLLYSGENRGRFLIS